MSTNINECAQEQTSMRTLRESGVALLTALLILRSMSSLLVGYSLMLMTDQRLNGTDRDQTQAFYGAEAGMEKLTADLGTLFDANYAPSGAQINALTTKPPSIPGVTYVGPNSTPGYQITFQADGLGNPVSQAIGLERDLIARRSEEHTSELQSRPHLVCRLLLEKKKKKENT